MTSRIRTDCRTISLVVTLRAGALAVAAGALPVAAQEPPATSTSGPEAVYTDSQAARGRAAYERSCAECHMADLAGHEYAGALAGFGFQLKWQDSTLGELLGRIRSMPLGRPGSLSSQEYVDILAYVLQKNGYPAGTTDLTAQIASRWPPIRIKRSAERPE